jgi:hypothetical protein
MSTPITTMGLRRRPVEAGTRGLVEDILDVEGGATAEDLR